MALSITLIDLAGSIALLLGERTWVVHTGDMRRRSGLMGFSLIGALLS
jgi:hypothetical protein